MAEEEARNLEREVGWEEVLHARSSGARRRGGQRRGCAGRGRRQCAQAAPAGDPAMRGCSQAASSFCLFFFLLFFSSSTACILLGLSIVCLWGCNWMTIDEPCSGADAVFRRRVQMPCTCSTNCSNRCKLTYCDSIQASQRTKHDLHKPDSNSTSKPNTTTLY